MTEDHLGAIFDDSTSRRRVVAPTNAPGGPGPNRIEDLIPDPVAVAKCETVLVDGTLIATSEWSDHNHLFSSKHHRIAMNVQVTESTGGTLLALESPVHGCRYEARAHAASGLADWLAGCEVIANLD